MKVKELNWRYGIVSYIYAETNINKYWIDVSGLFDQRIFTLYCNIDECPIVTSESLDYCIRIAQKHFNERILNNIER